MSIVIKSDQLNLLIYKYLCEANLSHAAYTFFNEAQLENSVSQYKYDIKPGQLVSILERGLIFNQIQSHVTINDYEQCNQPFHLIKQHTCKITKKIKQDNDKFLDQLNEQIYASMRRTSSVHNTLEPNKEYEEIIYEQKSANYLDRIPLYLQGTQNVKIGGNSNIIFAYDPQFSTVSLIKRHASHLGLEGVLPCIVDNKLSQPVALALSDDYLIRVFQGNICEITKIKQGKQSEPLRFTHDSMFTLPLMKRCSSINLNPKISQIVAFCSEDEFCVVNLQNVSNILIQTGSFYWKDACQYFRIQSNTITLKSLATQQGIQTFNNYFSKIDNISVSQSQIYFYAQSKQDNKIYVYTLEKSEPLYIFNFNSKTPNLNNQIQIQDECAKEDEQKEDEQKEEAQTILKCVWISYNSSDDLLIVTKNWVRTFGIELNNYLKVIKIKDYDEEIKDVAVLKKDESVSWVVCLGVESIIVYDAGQGKIQRIQYRKSNNLNGDAILHFPQGDYVGLKVHNNFYMAKDKDFDPLFI